ncbi:TadE/TadG family type IV pilus assembly protein [Shewanella cyperi]|uniref:Pilus assembly protein n=1 Tax=Shewanella cyperi TaxID=2814292 RepID=A0A974XLV9_9GAMM|nr:TadE family protein [Shewanella cyperi]QSX29648.1 pilus assembly protein [Shewanella cyperi]QSX40428.1 pilus assembly protein [Shewanella cyperi]
MKKQRGIYVVEFAIVGGVFFVLLFSALEIGRLFYTYSVLQEASRRAARLATVCYPTTDIDQLALFNGANLIPNLSASNLYFLYLKKDGTAATAPDGSDIDLVKAEIRDYRHQFLVPGLYRTLNSPVFSSTLPRESLGVYPGGITDCQ